MKKIILITTLIFAPDFLSAQVCDYWYPLKHGNHFLWNSYNAKNKLVGTNEYTVTSATTAGSSSNFSIHSVSKDEKGKELTTTDVQMQCTENALLIDMKNFIPPQTLDAYKDMEISLSGSTLGFPNTLQIGGTLPDGTISMTVRNSGMEMANIVVNVKDRKVEAQESITTPAGTFNCYKISSTTETITTTMGIKIPFTMKSVEYFSSGTGLIKSEAFNKDLKPMGYTELASFSK